MMRAHRPVAAAFAALAFLAGCESLPSAKVDKANPFEGTIAEDDSFNRIMLTVEEPSRAVEYFRQRLAAEPERTDLKRSYAQSLIRAKRFPEARLAYRDLVESGSSRPADRIEYAHALARLDQWDDVATQLDNVPSNYSSYRERLIHAMLADHREDWETADDAYDEARKKTAQPASVLNNWGVSKMARGDMQGAERTFEEALLYDPAMFSAKNNLTLTYGLQKQYKLPLVTLTEEERAILLHNLGVLALRQGDTDIAKGLFTRSVEVHPQHYEPSATKLAALEAQVGG